MIVKVRRIGNSVGVLLSKAMIEECSIKDEVSIEVKENKIIIQPVKNQVREGWADAFINAGSLTDKELLMDDITNSFDDEEWTW